MLINKYYNNLLIYYFIIKKNKKIFYYNFKNYIKNNEILALSKIINIIILISKLDISNYYLILVIINLLIKIIYYQL